MSEKHEQKRVIHVKDLVIKADNVVIEPQRHHDNQDRVDPFFGGPRRRNEEAQENNVRAENENESNNDHRGGFSWI
ncbi:hypothetical protein MUN89_16005 [Halobacillus salinarum]|uniref:Uncharacterized protein n=1 Tax=Halobacillus salinarum TaxID=2932257 RepID=A0ABY4EIT0_9BACI|nr:hypothetical protein [Halobacillus salinarum]UOQ43412.1 hypothetical protein MUN89_16005 [Halobacillus salinarum]